MASDFLVRPATLVDMPAVARLAAQLVRAHHAYDPQRFLCVEPVEAGYQYWLSHELANPEAVVLVAERAGEIIGYAYGVLEPRDWNNLLDAHGGLHDVLVTEGARGTAWTMRLLHKLGAGMGEDALIGGGAAQRFSISPSEARAERARLEADPEHVKKYTSGDKTARELLANLAFVEGLALAQAFLIAGAEVALASTRKTDDSFTYKVMSDLYGKHLPLLLTAPAEALHVTMNDVRARPEMAGVSELPPLRILER